MADTSGGTPNYGISVRASGLWTVYRTSDGVTVFRTTMRAEAYAEMARLNRESGSVGCWVLGN
jgi:hypothetical protein